MMSDANDGVNKTIKVKETGELCVREGGCDANTDYRCYIVRRKEATDNTRSKADRPL